MKRAALLEKNHPQQNEPYRIRIILQENRTATYTFSCERLARDTYDILRTLRVVGDFYIKDITYDKT